MNPSNSCRTPIKRIAVVPGFYGSGACPQKHGTNICKNQILRTNHAGSRNSNPIMPPLIGSTPLIADEISRSLQFRPEFCCWARRETRRRRSKILASPSMITVH